MKRLLITVAVLLAGCVAEINPGQIQLAIHLCENNAGLKSVKLYGDRTVMTVYCENGAAFVNVSVAKVHP